MRVRSMSSRASLRLSGGSSTAVSAVISTAVPHVQAGRARAIALTGEKRSPALPDVPTIGETIKGYVATNWYGLVAPAGTPKAIVDRLSKDLMAALSHPDVIKQLNTRGIDSTPTSPQAYAAYIRSETRKWVPIIRRANIKK